MTEAKDQRVVVLMTKDETEATENWMFAKRIRSRSEAIRHLIKKGLEAEAKEND